MGDSFVALGELIRSLAPNLKGLNLEKTDLDDDCVNILTNSLANNTKLKLLKLGSNNSVTPSGWRAFFIAMRHTNPSLTVLELKNNKIDDSSATCMREFLANTLTLKILDLSSNSSISPSSWIMLSSLLRNSKLEELHVTNSGINGEVMIAFSNALVDNKSLKVLSIGHPSHQLVTTRVSEAFLRLLCKKSSTNEILSSNHTLERLCTWEARVFPPSESIESCRDIVPLLRMNQNEVKFEVARQKILQYYFLKGTGSVQEFIDMKLTVLPHIISWFGRDDKGFELLYLFLQSRPSLFESDKAVTAFSGSKRKHSS